MFDDSTTKYSQDVEHVLYNAVQNSIHKINFSLCGRAAWSLPARRPDQTDIKEESMNLWVSQTFKLIFSPLNTFNVKFYVFADLLRYVGLC